MLDTAISVLDTSDDAKVLSVPVAVVVLNYRTCDLTLGCLGSIAKYREENPGLHVYLVDNDSQDGSVEKIRNASEANGWNSWLTVIDSGRNGGFASGNNRGIEEAFASQSHHFEAAWLLNSDTILREGAIAGVRDAVANDPARHVWGTRLEWPDGEQQVSCFRFFRPATELVEMAQTGAVTNCFARCEVPIHQDGLPVECEPDWVSFASVVIRREVIGKIGGLDDGYFMYFEDVDYCRHAREAGFSLGVIPGSRVIHLRGGSSDVKSKTAARKRRPRYYYASRMRYYAKWHGRRLGPLSANGAWYAGRFISLGRELLGRKTRRTCQAEWRDIWHNFNRPV